MTAQALPHAVNDMSALHLVDADDNFAVALAAGYVVLVWRREISDRGAMALRRAFKLIKEQPRFGTFGFLTVIRSDCNVLTSAEVRNAISEQLKANSLSIGAAAIAYEGAGFVSAVVRSVITAINIATRTSFPNEVFANTAEAIGWLTKKMREPDMRAAVALDEALNRL